MEHCKVDETAMIRKRCNRMPHHAQDSKRERSTNIKCDTSSEFVSLSIPSWQILTVHAQPFRGARDLAFCLKVLLDSLLVWASSGGSGETARMRRIAWTIAARIGDKYQIRLMRPKYGSTAHYRWKAELHFGGKQGNRNVNFLGKQGNR